MAHSLNNATKEQFKSRTGSYSTHGSRRGFVDIPLPIPKDQLNGVRDEFISLRLESSILKEKIKDGRAFFGIPQGKRLRDFAGADTEAWSAKKAHWSDHRWKLFDELRAQSKRSTEIGVKIKVLRDRLHLSAEPEDCLTHKYKYGDVSGAFKIDKRGYMDLILFKITCQKTLTPKLLKQINTRVGEAKVLFDD